MTSAEPSVSIALSRLTSAPRRASIATPIASARVIVGSSPSGTFATIRPIANLNASASGKPAASQPIGRKASPATTATRAISQATRRTWRSSGLSSVSTRSVSAAMRPSSVCMPVLTTSAFASPPTQDDPLNTRFRASIRGPLVSRSSTERYTGCDSPVSVERSTSSAPSIRRPSAEMRSPSASTRTSPGTSVAASIV